MVQLDPEEAQRQYLRAKEIIGRGRQAMAEGHRLMRGLSSKIVHARTRGQINQQIWECERLAGRRAQFFSQSGQDSFLDERVFHGKRRGVFVEIGGYDGISGSNCLFFELMRGWSGLLIEPSPTQYAKAKAFRRATCLQVALADAEGEAEFLDVIEGYSQMSGLTASYDEKLRATPALRPLMWLLTRVISTPLTHFAHHGKHLDDPGTHYTGNYGNLLFVWDLIFGSARIPDRYPAAYGVEHLPDVGAAEQLLWPLVNRTPSLSAKPPSQAPTA